MTVTRQNTQYKSLSAELHVTHSAVTDRAAGKHLRAVEAVVRGGATFIPDDVSRDTPYSPDFSARLLRVSRPQKSRSTFAYAPGTMAQAGRSSLRAWVTAAPPAAAAPPALPFAVGLVVDKARNEWDTDDNALKEEHVSKWPWGLWAGDLARDHLGKAPGTMANQRLLCARRWRSGRGRRWAGTTLLPWRC